ncbi:MAG: glycosyltransferase, partial [Candidatus Limnocylindrales bacterium]
GAGLVGRGSGVVGRGRAAVRATIRIAAIVLTVRAQVRASRTVDPGADLYHGMAYMGIPVALSLGRRSGGRVVYDARDIYVVAGNLARLPGPLRWLVGRLERGWARRADRAVTVNEAYADVMTRAWGERPLVVMNCAYRFDPPDPPIRRFHERLGLAPETRIVLYQGGFSPDRGIEQLIAAIPDVPQAVLVLMGYGGLQAAIERAAADPAMEGRVRVLPPVPPGDLVAWVAAADVVAMPIQATTLNHRLTTPNKLFEALAAGVPVLASDLPGMAPIVLNAGAGLVVDPAAPAAMAAGLRRILEPEVRTTMARQALAVAHARYNWESQATVLLGEYGRLTGRPW